MTLKRSFSLMTLALMAAAVTVAGCKKESSGRKTSRTVKATIATFDPDETVNFDLEAYGTDRPDDYAVEQAFNGSFGGLDACVLSAKQTMGVKPTKQLKGDMKVAVKLNPKSNRPFAVNAELPGRYKKNSKLGDCIREAVAKSNFPKYDGPPVVAEFECELDAGSEMVDEDYDY